MTRSGRRIGLPYEGRPCYAIQTNKGRDRAPRIGERSEATSGWLELNSPRWPNPNVIRMRWDLVLTSRSWMGDDPSEQVIKKEMKKVCKIRGRQKQASQAL